MNEAGLADTVDIADTTAQAAVPEEPEAAAPTKKAKRQAKPEARAEPPKPDPLFFAMLLRTRRLLEKDARAAKISSLRIV